MSLKRILATALAGMLVFTSVDAGSVTALASDVEEEIFLEAEDEAADEALEETAVEAEFEDAELLYGDSDVKVMLHANGGVFDNGKTDYEYEPFVSDGVVSLSIPAEELSRPGYAFTGWFADAECSQQLNLSNYAYYINEEDLPAEIYAGWTDEYYTVVFDGNGGQIADSGYNDEETGWEYYNLEDTKTVLVPKGKRLAYVSMHQPWNESFVSTPEGKHFEAWNTKADGTGDTIFFYTWNWGYSDNPTDRDFVPDKDITFYATYVDLIKVTYKAMDGYFPEEHKEGISPSIDIKDGEYSEDGKTFTVLVPKGHNLASSWGYSSDDMRHYYMPDVPLSNDEGLFFIGYSLNEDLSEVFNRFDFKFTIINEETTFYACYGTEYIYDRALNYEYTVDGQPASEEFLSTILNSNPKGYFRAENDVTDGDYKLSFIEPQSTSDVNFLGWYKDSTDQPLDYDSYEGIWQMTVYHSDKDIKVIGAFESAITLTIHYNVAPEQAGDTEKRLLKNGDLPEVEVPDKPGYYFAGWFTEDGGKGTAVDLTKPITASAECYAYWKKATVNVTFHSDNEGASDVTVAKTYTIENIDESLSLETVFAGKDSVLAKKDSFRGWETADSTYLATDTALAFLLKPTAETVTVDAYAQWEEDTYTVIFDIKGAETDIDTSDFSGSDFPVLSDEDLLQKKAYKSGEGVTFTGREFKRMGYKLEGWKLEDGKTIAASGKFDDLAKAGETVTLTAIWKMETYTLTYDFNGGKAVDPSKYPTEVKYTIADTPDMTPFYNMVLVETDYDDYTVTETAIADLADQVITKDGYVFDGWETTYENGEKFTGTYYCFYGGSRYQNFTLKAVWINYYYDLKMDYNGGTGTYADRNLPNYFEFQLKNVSATTIRRGYTLTGWKYDDNHDGKIDEKDKLIATDGSIKALARKDNDSYTLQAQWKPLNYTIGYSDGKGASHKNAVKKYTPADAAKTLISAPTKKGYAFEGYLLSYKNNNVLNDAELVPVDSEDLSKGYYLKADSYGNILLTAVWTLQQYTIEGYDAAGTEDSRQTVSAFYGEKVNLTELARNIKASEGKSVKGFALTKNATKAKYALNKELKVADLAKNADENFVIKLYAVEEAQQAFVKVESASDYTVTYKYDPSKNFKIKAPKVEGYTFTGFTGIDSGALPGVSGTDYVIDQKTKALTIKAGSKAFAGATIQAGLEPVKYQIKILPGAKGVTTSDGKTAIDQKKGELYQAGKEFFYNGEEVLTAPDWKRPGYVFIGYSFKKDGDRIQGNTVAGLKYKKGIATIYALWLPDSPDDMLLTTAKVANNEGATKDMTAALAEVPEGKKSYFVGKAFTLPTLTSPYEGYTFAGWELAAGSDKNVTKNKKGYVTKIKASNTDLSLKFRPVLIQDTVKVTLDPDGGTFNGSSKKVTVEALYDTTFLEVMKKAGFDKVSKKDYMLGYFRAEAGNSSSETWYMEGLGYFLIRSKEASVKAYWFKPDLTKEIKLGATVTTIDDEKVLYYRLTDAAIKSNYANNDADVYVELQYAADKDFTRAVGTKDLGKVKSTSESIPVKGDSYYVRARYYYIDSTGARIEGPWSDTVYAAGAGTDAKKKLSYGVFLSVNREDVAADDFAKFENFETIVLDVQNDFTTEDIKRLKAQGHTVYSYINVGALENYRDYYSDYEDVTLDVYENWPDEKWVDVSKEKWQSFILKDLGERIIATGVDGFFVDNSDVYYQYQRDEIYSGLETILKGLKKKGKVIVNGGDTFVRKYAADNGNLDAVLDGVNQESVFTTILDYDKDLFGESDPEEREYFLEYLSIVEGAGKEVYVLEYTRDNVLATRARQYFRQHGYKFYIADTLQLN